MHCRVIQSITAYFRNLVCFIILDFLIYNVVVNKFQVTNLNVIN